MYGTRIGAGRTAEIYEYGEQRVLKLYLPGMPEPQVEAEYRISQAACRAGIRTPMALARVRHDDRHGIVFEKIDGGTMLAALARRDDSVERESARMAQLHSQIHRIAVPGLPDQKSSLQDRIARAPLLSDEVKKRLARMLRDLPDDDRLCHGDFHPDNIMWGNQEWIIDWMTGMSGHPAGDAARTALLLRYGSLPDDAPAGVAEWLADMRAELLDGYLLSYANQTGTTREQIERWMPPVAAARLCEGIPEAEKEALATFVLQSLEGCEPG
ncbi:phosphotransferase family protein [Cohnella hashimotonis]|uniref:Aminoglycoside phosphotransferase family protein n=1 Tax=Cohnella hashimotonis TaxID=2826895 RepID=A0ABT6TR16_9BACL|nr:aminoglycoside phosphotransferase family protein [Cohnella hashimotonis]MDI4649294.1 aminoglycoside phosphotransferase family protein [Cohnella hashimotonis]